MNGPQLDLQRRQRTEMTSPFCTGGRAIVVLDEKTILPTNGQGARRNLMELRRGACESVTFYSTLACTTPGAALALGWDKMLHFHTCRAVTPLDYVVRPDRK